jgi:hypothetical protein
VAEFGSVAEIRTEGNMKIVGAIVFAALVIQGGFANDPQAAISKKWVPAVYRGLVVGRSTKADVLRVLGKPKSVGKEQDTGVPTISYAVSHPVQGMLVVYIRRGLLDSMSLFPQTQPTKDDIIGVLGSDYLVVRYAADDCLGEGGAAPIYEDRNGPIERIEYRSRGLAVSLHDGEVDAILFVAKPFGPTRSRCSGSKRKKHGKDADPKSSWGREPEPDEPGK